VIAMGPWSMLAAQWLPLPPVFGLKGHSLVFDTGSQVPPDALFLEYQEAGHGWRLCDVTNAFARWMAEQDYREAYFESPEDLPNPHPGFEDFVADHVRRGLEAADEDDVVAVSGVASLYGFMKVSRLMEMVERTIRGRLLVFFPGEYEDNNYRLLDARDGWNYHAVPITAAGGLESA